jgi:glycerophosphoryl diester phosphodiesterase
VQVADNRLAVGALWPFFADPEAGLALAVEEGWRAVHPFVSSVTPALVERAQGAGLAVNAWTVNAAADLATFVALGVDGVITDNLVEALSIAAADGAG